MLEYPQLQLGTPCRQLKIDHGRNIYTLENGECYKSGFCWFVYFLKSFLLNIY